MLIYLVFCVYLEEEEMLGKKKMGEEIRVESSNLDSGEFCPPILSASKRVLSFYLVIMFSSGLLLMWFWMWRKSRENCPNYHPHTSMPIWFLSQLSRPLAYDSDQEMEGVVKCSLVWRCSY